MTAETAPDATPQRLARDGGVSIAYQRHQGKADLPGVIFLGGFNSDMIGTKATALHAFCSARDQSFIRFDYQGHGQSSGRFEDGTIGSWFTDSLAVFDALTTGPQILVGSSMGGWLSLLLALARPERICGLIGIAPAPDFTETLMWSNLPESMRRTILETGQVRVPSEHDGGGYVITRALIEDGRNHLLLQKPIALGCALRLLHGTADTDVPWQHSVKLVEAFTGEDVVLTLIKGGDHRLSTPADLARLMDTVKELSIEI